MSQAHTQFGVAESVERTRVLLVDDDPKLFALTRGC
jgi:hypothetical protein